MKRHPVLLVVGGAVGLGQGWRRQVRRAEKKQRRVIETIKQAKKNLLLALDEAGRIEKVTGVRKTCPTGWMAFSISKRLRILGNFFLPHYPTSHQDYFTNLTLIAHFIEFNEPNFIISIKN